LPVDVIRQTKIDGVLRDIIIQDSIPQNLRTRAQDLNAAYANIREESVANTSAPQVAPVSEQPLIGADTIPEKDQSLHPQPEDNEELAKTAGALLDSVKHDQSEKFRSSNFLALMRRLRDREVQVQGDEFKDVSTV
jgi:hypothetical protein